MSHKKLFAISMAAIMMLTVLAGCGGASSAPAAPAAPATPAASAASAASEPAVGETPCTLRLSWWGGDARHEATQKAAEAFMAKYPNIKVEVEFGAWTGWEENISTQLLSGTAPDVMQVNWNWITSYSEDDSSFYDLNTVSDVLDITQWDKPLLEQCTVGGNNLQAIPVAVTGRIFYWNKSTWEKAGLSTPKTFAELMDAGEVFRTKLGEDYYPMVMGEYDRMIFMVHYLECKYGKNWVENGKVNYTEEEVKDGLDILKEMEAKHVIPTLQKLDGDGADSLDKNQNWIDGHYAGIFEWDSSASKFVKAAPDSEIVVGDFMSDIGSNKGGFTKVSLGFAISSKTEHPKEAALLIQYLLNEEEGVKLLNSQRGIPASKAALKICTDNDLLDKTVAEANGKVLAWCSYSLDPKFEDNALKGDPEGIYYKVMSKVSYGTEDTAAGAKEMVDGINSLLAK